MYTCVLQKHKDIHRNIIHHDQNQNQIKNVFCTTWQWMVPHLLVWGQDTLASGGYFFERIWSWSRELKVDLRGVRAMGDKYDQNILYKIIR